MPSHGIARLPDVKGAIAATPNSIGHLRGVRPSAEAPPEGALGQRVPPNGVGALRWPSSFSPNVPGSPQTGRNDAENGLLTVGNSRVAMVRSVEASLRRLRTDRIDLLWAHMPDGGTSSEELMRGLDDLVRAGKVLYLGLSDFPAWRVARAATIAELRGWAPLVGLQVEYSLVERTPERELLPMAQALGLGTVGWSPLGRGLLTGKYRRGEEGRASTFKRLIHPESDPIKTRTADTLLAVADEAGVAPSAVALDWVRARGVIPILGPRTADQLRDNLAALDFTLSGEQVARLDAASATPLGFPHDMLASDVQKARLAAGIPADVDSPVVPVS